VWGEQKIWKGKVGMWSIYKLEMSDSEKTNGGDIKERSDIPNKFKWRLDRIFPDTASWEANFKEVEDALPGLLALQGTLENSGAHLLAAIEAVEWAQRRLETGFSFASMTSDQDTRISGNTANKGRIGSLAVRFSEAVSWFESELLAVTPERLAELVAEEDGLQVYAHFMDNIQRSRAHTLTADQEALLAGAGIMARGASQVFGAFDNADLVFGEIEDEDGQMVQLTKARYQKFMKSDNRKVRQDAFNVFLGAYGSMKNTLAANMDANVKNHVFYATARKHEGAMEAALHPSGVPSAVFHSLVETVSDNLPTIHRYTELKKRVLGYDTLREHDLSLPLFNKGKFKFEYDDACAMLLEAFAPLGQKYVDTVAKGIKDGWIDVHENAGKRSGAYSSGTYDTPPFILLNWADQLGDTFTLAHELGHSMHTYLATSNQPYTYGDYPIFTAEVASTFNELLVMQHLLKNTDDVQKKLYLLDYHLSQINNTVFRQTMFAEFEYLIHRQGEKGETLTADGLGNLYKQMLVKYWGPEVAFNDQLSPLTWSRIPHFFYNFYVYQYSTAYSAAVALSRKVLKGGEDDREQYLDILRSGSSRYPVETIKLGGVDMASPGPMEDVVALFGSLIGQVEDLL
jgi:oligoendopeptidase F